MYTSWETPRGPGHSPGSLSHALKFHLQLKTKDRKSSVMGRSREKAREPGKAVCSLCASSVGKSPCWCLLFLILGGRHLYT